MASKEMDLMVRIRANGAQALSELSKVDTQLGALLSKKIGGGATGSALAAGLGTGFRVISAGASMAGDAIDLMLKPLRIAGTAALGFGAFAAGMGVKAVRAAGDMETLKMRLEAVSGSAAEGQKIFDEAKKLSIGSPFDETALIEGAIALKMMGNYGPQNLKAIGDASAISQVPVEDLATAIGALRARSLKPLGIMLDLDENGEKAKIQFTDKMGQLRTIAAKGSADIKAQLFNALDIKFGGGMTRAGMTFRGMLTGLSREFHDLLAEGLGPGLMPAAMSFLSALRDGMKALVSPEEAKAFGEGVGQWLMTASDKLVAAFRVGQDIFASGKAMESLGIMMRAGAEILVRALIEYLQALGGIFMGMGRILAGAFLETLFLRARFLREPMVADAIMAMTPEERVASGIQTQIESRGNALDVVRGLSVEKQTELVSGAARERGVRVMEEGLNQARGAIPQAGANLRSITEEVGRQAMGEIGAATGIDIPGRLRAYEADVRTGRQSRMADRSMWMATPGEFQGPIDQRQQGSGIESPQYYRNPKGLTFSGSAATSAQAPSINITNLKVHSDRPGRLRSQLIRRAAGAAAVAAAV